MNSDHKKRARDITPQSSHDSPPRKNPRLETAHYPAGMHEHARMDTDVLNDEDIAQFRDQDSITTPKNIARFLLLSIVDHSDFLDKKYARRAEAANLLKSEVGLMDELEKAWKAKSFATIRSLAILQPRQPIRASHNLAELTVGEQFQATAAAWQTPYESGSDEAFLQTIKSRYAETTKLMYAHHIAVVQSSGTGKSRMLHEVSRKVFTVILNFGYDMSGFPKPDEKVRDYLTNSSTAEECEQVAASFFVALFDKLSAGNFEAPSSLSTFLGYGDPDKAQARAAYFDDVINTARQMKVAPTTPPRTEVSPSVQMVTSSGDKRSLIDAASDLSAGMLDKFNSKYDIKLVLGFDEASELTINPRNATWNVFTQIRRVLRSLRTFPIYSAFMSTTGSVRQFHPRQNQDKSTRVQDGRLRLWPPFTLVGFDQLANKLREGQSLDDATTMEFMLGLGRPLFKTRYDNGTAQVKAGIVQFAQVKLLTGNDDDGIAPNIAPLAVRLPLSFNALTHKGREAEQRQVESHMRICLNIVPEADVMYTVAPSEPVLVEAAAQTMRSRDLQQPGHSVGILHQFLSNRYLSKGDRGELASMLLMLLAHDAASCARPDRHKSMPYHTLLPLTDFLTNLFAEAHCGTILEAKAAESGPSLQEAFKDSWTHFTHFVKVSDHKVINRRFLMRMMVRGAAVLCADNQLGIDAIIPVCYRGKTLHPDNITAILVQSKNVHTLLKSRTVLYDNMDPMYTGVFDKGSTGDIPVIKIVLSVGTTSPAFTCPPARKRYSHTRSAKTVTPSQLHFKFFAAGLSHEIFRPIQEAQEATWRCLVSRSGVEDIYTGSDGRSVLDVVRRMTPCLQSDPKHWDAFFPLDTGTDVFIGDTPDSDEEDQNEQDD